MIKWKLSRAPRNAHPAAAQALTRRRSTAFTLVEILVVIAIIGLMIGLMLPAVQAAREASRQVQCKNNQRQLAMAILNYESARGQFPQGGTVPITEISYRENGPDPWPVDGLSWPYHILPYIEEVALHGQTSLEAIEPFNIPTFYCSSRRTSAQLQDKQGNVRASTDYATPTPGPFVASGGRLVTDPDSWKVLVDFWKGHVGKVPQNEDYRGIITRTASSPPTLQKRITDGVSKTMLLGEKRMIVSKYDSGEWFDLLGWSSGWSVSTVRSSGFPPEPDSTRLNGPGITDSRTPLSVYVNLPREELVLGHQFGSAHPSGMHATFADGRSTTISYDIDPEVFNRLGDRRDGLPVE